jgi:hypothetical protein
MVRIRGINLDSMPLEYVLMIHSRETALRIEQDINEVKVRRDKRSRKGTQSAPANKIDEGTTRYEKGRMSAYLLIPS